MGMGPDIREMQNIIARLRSFANENGYNLCRDWQVRVVLACADMLETIISARGWEPVD